MSNKNKWQDLTENEAKKREVEFKERVQTPLDKSMEELMNKPAVQLSPVDYIKAGVERILSNPQSKESVQLVQTLGIAEADGKALSLLIQHPDIEQAGDLKKTLINNLVQKRLTNILANKLEPSKIYKSLTKEEYKKKIAEEGIIRSTEDRAFLGKGEAFLQGYTGGLYNSFKGTIHGLFDNLLNGVPFDEAYKKATTDTLKNIETFNQQSRGAAGMVELVGSVTSPINKLGLAATVGMGAIHGSLDALHRKLKENPDASKEELIKEMVIEGGLEAGATAVIGKAFDIVFPGAKATIKKQADNLVTDLKLSENVSTSMFQSISSNIKEAKDQVGKFLLRHNIKGKPAEVISTTATTLKEIAGRREAFVNKIDDLTNIAYPGASLRTQLLDLVAPDKLPTSLEKDVFDLVAKNLDGLKNSGLISFKDLYNFRKRLDASLKTSDLMKKINEGGAGSIAAHKLKSVRDCLSDITNNTIDTLSKHYPKLFKEEGLLKGAKDFVKDTSDYAVGIKVQSAIKATHKNLDDLNNIIDVGALLDAGLYETLGNAKTGFARLPMYGFLRNTFKLVEKNKAAAVGVGVGYATGGPIGAAIGGAGAAAASKGFMAAKEALIERPIARTILKAEDMLHLGKGSVDQVFNFYKRVKTRIASQQALQKLYVDKKNKRNKEKVK